MPDSAQNTNEWFMAPERLQRITSGDTTVYDEIVHDILNWLTRQLEIVRAPRATTREISAWMADDVRRKLSDKPDLIISLLLDSVFETDHNLLDRIEQYLLAPLITLPRVLVVMTGRGRAYLWKLPYLRLESEEAPLTSFDRQLVIAQIRAIWTNLDNGVASKLAEKIVASGITHPLTVRLFAEKLLEKTGLPPDASPEALTQALDQTDIDGAMVNDVVSRLLKGIVEDDDLRKDLEAISILKEGFRETELPRLLAQRHNKEPPRRPDVRRLVDRLLAISLVRWKDGRYVVDEAVRVLLEMRLQHNEKEVWRALHRSAAEQYQEWADTYSSSYYGERAEHHRRILGEAHTSNEAVSV